MQHFAECGKENILLCMSALAITIKPTASGRKLIVEMDADRLERLASSLGLYNPDFLKSIDRAESDLRSGRIHRIASLRKWRSKK